MILRGRSLSRLVSPRPYLGHVATRARVNSDVTPAGNIVLNMRSGHIARTAITAAKVAWWNGYIPVDGVNGLETGSGTTVTYTASIEYPAGTFHQLRFNGATSATIPSGALQWSDLRSVSIPDGALFWIRQCFQLNGNIVFVDASGRQISGLLSNALFGDALDSSTGTDLTLSGTVSNDQPVVWMGPAAIVGWTTKPSFGLLGDSRVQGVGDTMDATGDVGIFARSIGSRYGYTIAASGGRTAVNFVASNTVLRQLLRYSSHIISSLGAADVIAYGRTPAQAIADMQTIAGYFAPRPVWTCTCWPISDRTDGWTTTTNQTPVSTWSDVVTLNQAIRAGITPYAGYFECADVLSTSRDSGIWIAPGGAPQTIDGVHTNQAGSIRLRDAGVVDPRRCGTTVWAGPLA